MKRIAEASPRLIARIAAAFYVMVFVTGTFSLLVRSGVGYAAALLAGVFYIVVTLLFYFRRERATMAGAVEGHGRPVMTWRRIVVID